MYDPDLFSAPPDDDLSGVPATVRQKAARFKLGEATPREIAEMRASYYGLISHIDWHIGQIIDALERRNLLDNTVIIYSTDHGEMLGEHRLIQKSVFYEGAVRVPLIIRYPARVQSGTSDALVELLDLTPTILELAGTEPLRTCEGRSLLPLLERPAAVPADWRDCVYSELKGEHMIRTDRYKYTYRKGEARQELFDLRDDPDELRNRAGDAAYEEIERGLRDRLLTWLVATNRPLNTSDLQPGTLDEYRTEEIRPLLN